MVRNMRNSERNRLSLFSSRAATDSGTSSGKAGTDQPEVGGNIGDHVCGHWPLLGAKALTMEFSQRLLIMRGMPREYSKNFPSASSEKIGGSGGAPARSSRDRM